MLVDERLARNWSQAYTGKLIGISRNHLSSIETGDKKPSYEVLVKLEDLFHKSHRELIPAKKKNVRNRQKP